MDDYKAAAIGSDVLRDSVEKVGVDDTKIQNIKESRFSYVTKTDKRLDEEIRKRLTNRSDYPVISEESDNTTESDEYWIVDPIDGTAPFAHGMPNYLSMLAFVSDDVPIASALYAPATDDMYTATQKKARLADQEITASENTSIVGNAVFNSVRADGEHDDQRFRELHSKLTHESLVFGVYCAAYGAVKIATGEATAAMYMELHEWDYMPTVRIVESSGGVVGSLETGEVGIDTVVEENGEAVCFASSKDVFDELVSIY